MKKAILSLTILLVMSIGFVSAATFSVKVSPSATSTTLTWNQIESADSYEIYRDSTLRTTTSTLNWTDTGLSPNTSYTYSVEAYSEGALIAKSSVSVTTKKQPTSVVGSSKSLRGTARHKGSVTVTAKGTMGRPVHLQYYSGNNWITKQTVKTQNTINAQKVKLTFPNLWWKKNSTKWRYVILGDDKIIGSSYGTVTLRTKRYYQNPEKYIQIKNKISKHGHNYYTAPVLTNNTSTRKQHVEAMIKTARKYLGDPYVDCRSRAPGRGVDCSGLVMQACYGAGVDLWPSNPWRHRFPKFEYESRRIAKMKTLKTVKWKNRKRGDLIFYSRGGRVMHVAIYIGKGKIIHSSTPRVRISSATNPAWGKITRVARVFI